MKVPPIAKEFTNTLVTLPLLRMQEYTPGFGVV
jgi:hypothetical protein